MSSTIMDLEQTFRPSPTDPNWLGNVPATTKAVTYGISGRQQQTYQDAYGAEPVQVPFTTWTVEPVSVLVGAVIGIVGVFLYNKYVK